MATFDERAADWDTPQRIERAHAAAEAIRAAVEIPAGTRAIELGAGTGLLGLALLDQLDELVLADASSGMLAEAERKIRERSLSKVRTVRLDLATDPPPPGAPFDLALSLLLLHHVEDTRAALRAIATLLRSGGILAALDLDAEDGTFHGPDTPGVHHQGFERSAIGRLAAEVGFADVASGDGGRIEREDGVFPLFLLTARRA